METRGQKRRKALLEKLEDVFTTVPWEILKFLDIGVSGILVCLTSRVFREACKKYLNGGRPISFYGKLAGESHKLYRWVQRSLEPPMKITQYVSMFRHATDGVLRDVMESHHRNYVLAAMCGREDYMFKTFRGDVPPKVAFEAFRAAALHRHYSTMSR